MIPESKIYSGYALSNIDEIRPKMFYKKSGLSYCKDSYGKSIYSALKEEEAKGTLEHVPYRSPKGHQAHLWYGGDILDIVKGIESRTQKKTMVQRMISLSSRKELAAMLSEYIELEHQHHEVKAEKQRLKTINKNLSKAIEILLMKIEGFDSAEQAMVEHFHNFIFNHGQKVFWYELSSEDLCGVYLLKTGEEIVYIGQSINVPSRVQQHIRDGKIFDSVAIIPCDKEYLDTKEMFLIKLIKPPLNGPYKNGKHPDIIERALPQNSQPSDQPINQRRTT